MCFSATSAPTSGRVDAEIPQTRTRKEWNALLAEMTDLRSPAMWYPLARKMGPRNIILHVGPTNSGKTHTAIEDLIKSHSGVYCGPLRLLAQEIYRKLNDRGVPCSLVTGQKVVETPEARHIACTVEMASVREVVDVAVLDEYQLLGDSSRGWAWTRALLGLPARTVHVCGDASAIALLEQITAETGDTLTVKHYNRLSPLKPSRHPLERPVYADLQPGDCIVTFSKAELYRTKGLIEKHTDFQCCVVYGDLPPDTRAQQAALFNDPDSGFDILIATDAIGLGLNLNIRRIVFSTIRKFDGEEFRELTISEIKQIAGRAGRFKSAYPIGEVTAFDDESLATIKRSLAVEIGPSNPHLLTHEAGLLPQFEQFEALHDAIGPQAAFVQVLDLFEKIAKTDRHFFLCSGESLREIAVLLEGLDLELSDQYALCLAPVDTRNEVVCAFMRKFAQLLARGRPVPAPRLPELLRAAKNKITAYETAFKVVDLYLWLSYRFPAFFSERDDAEKLKDKISTSISKILLFRTEEPPKALAKRGRGSRKQPDKLHLNRDRDSREGHRGRGQDRTSSSSDSPKKLRHFKLSRKFHIDREGVSERRRASHRNDEAYEGGFGLFGKERIDRRGSIRKQKREKTQFFSAEE